MRMRVPLDGFVTRTNGGREGRRRERGDDRASTSNGAIVLLLSVHSCHLISFSLSISLWKVQHRVYCPRSQKGPLQFTPRRTICPSVRPPVSTRCRGYPLRCCPPILHSSWQIISRSKRGDANGERTENPFCIASRRRRRRIQCTAFSSPSQRPTDGRTDGCDGWIIRRGRKGTEFGLLIETLSLAVAAMPLMGMHPRSSLIPSSRTATRS